jgi:outer membrane protein OmpA-like peptidoglycan-associated protein
VTRDRSRSLLPPGGGVRLFLALVLGAAPAAAQVSVDLHALDQLNGGRTPPPKAAPKSGNTRQAAPKEPHPKPAKKSETARRKPAEQAPAAAQTPSLGAPPPTAAPPPPVVAAPAVPPAAAPPAAILPSGPPPNVRLSPLTPEVPAGKPTPPAEPAVAADAAGAAASTAEGLRVTFGNGRAELNPATESAIKDFAQKAPKTENASINVLAYAAGTQEDPSTARRLSLSRALAVRSVLMAEGVASTHIYLRALGSAGGDGPPDRVDLSVMGANTPTGPATSATSATPASAPGAPK